MVRGDNTRMIFIDSSLNTTGCATRVMLPPIPFSAGTGEKLALTLSSFTLRRNWYNINPTNSIFFLYYRTGAGATTLIPVQIPSGVYRTFESTAETLQNILQLYITGAGQGWGVSVVYDPRTRAYGFTFTNVPVADTLEVRCFHYKEGPAPGGLNVQGDPRGALYNDSYEILGARYSSDATGRSALDVSRDTNTNTTVIMSSPYPVSLNTLDAVYLHFDTETGNFQSTGFSQYASDSLRVMESSIFARVAFNESFFSENIEVVRFEDNGGDQFQSFLSRKNLDFLSIRVTDARGRCLSARNPQQAADGLMTYRLGLRWDLFKAPPSDKYNPGMGFDKPLHLGKPPV